MSRLLSVAVAQMACGSERKDNIDRAAALVRKAVAQGAQVVVLQELFETPYFCIEIEPAHRREARALDANPAIPVMQELARRHDVVIPVSVYERDGEACYNTLVIVDAGGEVLGHYRKSHIPDFPA